MNKPPKIKGKVLTFGNIYVDVHKLYRGIYGTDTPYVYPPYETKQQVIGHLEQGLGPNHSLVMDFRSNLDQCEWTDVTITVD
jgi:hypothetical protein